MKKFRITEQDVIVAPKANKDVGKETTYIREAESFEMLLRGDDDGNGWLHYNPANTDKYAMTLEDFNSTVKEIKDNGGVFFTNKYGEYWDTDPRSEDGYALEGTQITVEELNEAQIKAHEEAERKAAEAEQKAKEAKLKKNNDDWDGLFYGADSLDSLLVTLKQYKFPTKL